MTRSLVQVHTLSTHGESDRRIPKRSSTPAGYDRRTQPRADSGARATPTSSESSDSLLFCGATGPRCEGERTLASKAGGPACQTNALSPVIALPTIRVFISLVPSKE